MLYWFFFESHHAVATLVASLVLLCIYIVCRYLEPTVDALEPEYARATLPLVGHIIGFLRFGSKYTEGLIQYRKDKEIRSINFGWKRAYIIGSLDLTAAVQRQSATISFSPVVKMMAESLSHFGPALASLFDADVSRVEQPRGLSHDTLAEYHRAFGTGAGSEELQNRMLNELIRLLPVQNAFEASQTQQTQRLWSWLRHIITQASMRSIYGLENPLRDPNVEEAFWEFELECGALLMNVAPDLVAPKAMRARRVLDEAFAEYYSGDALSKASELAWARYQPPASYGLKPEDIGRLESPFLFAVLATSVPTCFWTFIEIHRHPNLLAEVREELSKAISIEHTERDDENGHTSTSTEHRKKYTVQIERLKTECPLILSVFQETLRLQSIFSLFRIVTSDTMLAGRYLLKAGSLVLMPSNIIHRSTKIWGTDAAEFDPYRFMASRKDIPKINFRSFGDAPFLCPGRHFATTEIISILCLLVMRYDFKPQGGNGKSEGEWTPPRPHLAVFNAVMPPRTDVIVSLRPRDGWQGDWSFDLGDSKVKFPLVSG